MKFIVTPKNIKSVAKMIEKLAKNKKLISKMYYPTAKKEATFLKNIGIKKHIITESNTSVFDSVAVEIDFMFDKHFIRIHNKENDFDYRAFVIHCGNVVDFKNNIIYLRTEHPTQRNYRANEIIKFV